MKEPSRTETLIHYLEALAKVNRNSGVKVYSEIKRTISEIKKELKIGE